jgi:hypothetical protein
MWDYTNRQDPTRISSDELKEAEIDDGVRAVTSLKKKSIVPKIFDAVAFSKSRPRTEVRLLCLLTESFRLVMNLLQGIESG